MTDLTPDRAEPAREPVDEVRTKFWCGHYFGEEPESHCGPNHWSRTGGVGDTNWMNFTPEEWRLQHRT